MDWGLDVVGNRYLEELVMSNYLEVIIYRISSQTHSGFFQWIFGPLFQSTLFLSNIVVPLAPTLMFSKLCPISKGIVHQGRGWSLKKFYLENLN